MQAAVLQRQFVGYGHVVGVPRLFVVGRDVGTVVVTLAYVDESVVYPQPAPLQVGCGGAAVPWDIGYLAAVGKRFIGVGEVLRPLVV